MTDSEEGNRRGGRGGRIEEEEGRRSRGKRRRKLIFELCTVGTGLDAPLDNIYWTDDTTRQ